MTTFHQPSLFDGPDRFALKCQGIFIEKSEQIHDKPPTVESNAVKKRNKRAAWYVSQCLKKDGAQRENMAERRI